MDPGEAPLGRSRGRGRSLYQHPPVHGSQLSPRTPWSLTEGGPRPPLNSLGRQLLSYKAPLPIGVTTTGTSFEDTASPSIGPSIGRGRGQPVKYPTSSDSPSTSFPSTNLTKVGSGSDSNKKIIYPDARPTAGDIDRKRRVERQLYIRTRPKEIETKVGTDGQKITCEANYFRFRKAPTWNIYLHRIDFEPEILLDKTRRDLMRSINGMFGGGYLFDGTQLFLTKKLEDPNGPIERTVNSDDGKAVNIMIRFVGVVSMQEERAIQIMNLILRRAMDGLHLQTVGRNKYDAAAKEIVRALRVEVWPGYITSIRQHEQDILMCAEIGHKIMRAETVYDIIVRVRHEARHDFHKALEKTLLGTTVLTDYNNKTYRIDDIRYDICPTDTFPTKDGEISYVDYYKKYNKTIIDLKQPLLVSNLKEKDIRGGQADKIILVPELCRATGLTEDMRTNFRTMKELSTYTRVGPASRMERLRTFNQRLRTSPESVEILKRWNLELDPDLIKIPARILPLPKLLFGGDRSVEVGASVDWTAEFRTRSMFHSVELKRWYLVVPSKAVNEAKIFLKSIQQAGRGMFFTIEDPKIKELPNDTQVAVSNVLTECGKSNPQMIVCIVSTNSADRYATIKKRCFVDFGIPNQVIVHKTITPKDKSRGPSGLLSVATKVAIQMNCKLGGLPWIIDMPLTGLMTIGYDVCHDPKDKKASWGAVVATMDLKKRNCQFFSAVNRHTNAEEMSNYLAANIAKALQQFYEINGTLPQRILFFRDGVGDGHIAYVYNQELVAIRNKMKDVYLNMGFSDEIKFAYMIVTKKVNTRFFFNQNNPKPGTCVDDVITLPERFDFYLVSQTVNQGTVSPTSFNVIFDSMGIPPDRLQQLAFRFTFFYFNWTGSVRVPAMCQYAHKLAFLASQSMQTTPHCNLNQTLYYL